MMKIESGPYWFSQNQFAGLARKVGQLDQKIAELTAERDAAVRVLNSSNVHQSDADKPIQLQPRRTF